MTVHYLAQRRFLRFLRDSHEIKVVWLDFTARSGKSASKDQITGIVIRTEFKLLQEGTFFWNLLRELRQEKP